MPNKPKIQSGGSKFKQNKKKFEKDQINKETGKNNK